MVTRESFTFMCSTSPVSSEDWLSGGRVEVTLEGLTFVRSKSAAETRGTKRVYDVEWPQIERAELVIPALGRPILWVVVTGADDSADAPDVRFAYKVKRRFVEPVRALVSEINQECEARRRWAHPDQT
ncbi:hypothetical protein NOCA2150133 [metagenome]|uniref:Uncharacterized protein n=1 Tax=metagenome TaxID=256318 RepID=A0A2P2BXB4_9ZZZZ